MLTKTTSRENLRVAKTFGLSLRPEDREKLIAALIKERDNEANASA